MCKSTKTPRLRGRSASPSLRREVVPFTALVNLIGALKVKKLPCSSAFKADLTRTLLPIERPSWPWSQLGLRVHRRGFLRSPVHVYTARKMERENKDEGVNTAQVTDGGETLRRQRLTTAPQERRYHGLTSVFVSPSEEHI